MHREQWFHLAKIKGGGGVKAIEYKQFYAQRIKLGSVYGMVNFFWAFQGFKMQTIIAFQNTFAKSAEKVLQQNFSAVYAAIHALSLFKWCSLNFGGTSIDWQQKKVYVDK